MERMTYKGFESTPKHDEEEGVFYGLVDDVDGLCEYESETAEGVEKAFRDAVDDYLDASRESFGRAAIDMERYYGRREAAARENGNDELAVMYQRLKVIEGLARSGQLSESMSRVLSANTSVIYSHAGGLVAECGRCGCLVDEKWDFCARCGVHFVDLRYAEEFSGSDPE